MNLVPVSGMPWGFLVFIFLLLTLIPGTILGWIAAKRIRESGGTLYGLRLAALAGLFFPAILLILASLFSFALVMRIGFFSDFLSEADSLILGIAVFAAIALIGVRVFQGCCRKILGRGGFAELFGLARNRYLLLGLGILWVGLGALFVLQRPKPVGELVAADSPDQVYRVEASTWHRMHVFGADKMTYRFEIQGRGGSISHSWEIPIPTARLSTGYEAQPSGDFQFSNKGTIHWRQDSSLVVFMVDGTEVFQIDPHSLTGTTPGKVAGEMRVEAVQP